MTSVSAVLVLLALSFGGGARHGLLSDVFPQIFSVITLFYVAQQGLARMKASPFHVFCMVALIGLPLLQLIPIPASLWLALPGRGAIRDMYMVLDIEPVFHSLSLRPSETWRALLSFIPAATLALCVSALDLRSRILLILIVLIFAGINVLIALAQIIGGEGSALYFYEITNRGRAVGLFANANHYTAFLYASVPFVAALFSGSSERRVPVRDAVLSISLFLLLVGLAISGSRTALILGGVSFILSIALISGKTMARLFSIRHGRAAAAIAMLFLLPILFGVGFVQIFLRLQTQDTFADLRYQIFDTLWRVMTIYMPFGSGFGTFDTVYQMHESLGTLSAFYVNHAHNDVLELLIEGGAISAIALIGFGVGLVGFTISAFAQTNLIEERIEKACVISLWMLTIHSFWDYPLRTIAVSSLFGIAFGSLVKPRVINIETLSDVFHRMKARRFYEWIETTIGKQSQRRRRQRLSRPH